MPNKEQAVARLGVTTTPGVIDVWVIGLDVEEPRRRELEQVLSEDERTRARRFHFDRDRHRFIVGRGAVRTILGDYLALPPESLRFSYSENGKPGLSGISTHLRFNLSHSDRWGLLAVTEGREIGADIERIRPEVETDKLAERFFSANERAALRLMSAPDRAAAFYRGWACKESLLKAWGTGLSRPLNSFDVDLELNHPAALEATRPDAGEAKRWSLRMLDIAEGYASAFAVEGQILAVLIRRWTS
jgi:4'-phosphopantetheinyl transferase